MKKLITLVFTFLVSLSLLGCKDDEKTIRIAASELPHAKILNEVVKDILKEKGYELEVTVLDWTIQNDAIANNEYDANYFQHIPYLNTYQGKVELAAAVKVHYEKLCAYANDINHKTVENGDEIVMVDDISNAERALNLLVEQGIITIKDSAYNEEGVFTNFEASNPYKSIEFTENYKDCKLTCIPESTLCQSLSDYDFGIIPGNTALTGLDKLAERIAFGEANNETLIDEKANIIAVKKSNIDSPKTKALVEAFADPRVQAYIESTFGESVL